MKSIFKILALLITSVTTAHAGCLDSLASSDIITSKIRGLYVTPDSSQYVILDKASCISRSGSTPLASGTSQHYYLKFNSANTFLASSLLASYTKGEVVEFRLGAIEGIYNKIAYIVIPANARAQ